MSQLIILLRFDKHKRIFFSFSREVSREKSCSITPSTKRQCFYYVETPRSFSTAEQQKKRMIIDFYSILSLAKNIISSITKRYK